MKSLTLHESMLVKFYNSYSKKQWYRRDFTNEFRGVDESGARVSLQD